jgi:hypothetical protein
VAVAVAAMVAEAAALVQQQTLQDLIIAGSNMTTPAGNMTGGASTVNPAALQLGKDNLIRVVAA